MVPLNSKKSPVEFFEALGWDEFIEPNVIRRAALPAEDRPRILSIDDEPEISEALEMRLDHEGYEVVRANHGMDGYRYAFELAPFAILLDYNMPHVNGEQVLLSLRSNPVTGSIPIVIISGKCDNRAERRLVGLGAKAFLPKPVQYDRLLKILNDCKNSS